jgi:phage protein U
LFEKVRQNKKCLVQGVLFQHTSLGTQLVLADLGRQALECIPMPVLHALGQKQKTFVVTIVVISSDDH